MIITILNVAYEKVPTAKGSYGKLDVAYKNEQGKTEGKKIMSFTNEAVFNMLRLSKAGDVFNVTVEKDDKNYWQWTTVLPSTGGAAPAQEPTRPVAATGGATASPKSTYETAEERAKKQVYIVRQSSISSALEYSKSVKALKTVEDVIKVAQQFEAFVFGVPFDDGSMAAMPDDADMVIR